MLLAPQLSEQDGHSKTPSSWTPGPCCWHRWLPCPACKISRGSLFLHYRCQMPTVYQAPRGHFMVLNATRTRAHYAGERTEAPKGTWLAQCLPVSIAGGHLDLGPSGSKGHFLSLTTSCLGALGTLTPQHRPPPRDLSSLLALGESETL